MKRILFVFPDINAGNGPVVALTNLLNLLSHEEYKIDLLLTSRYDEEYSQFWDRIPIWINILPPLYQLDKYSKSLICELRSTGLGHMADIREKVHLLNSHFGEDRFRNWEELKKIVPVYSNYDIAIAYTEDIALQIVVDRVVSNKKVGWFHTDYNISYEKHMLLRKSEYWESMDSIICVSNYIANEFYKCYCNLKDRIRVLYNVIDYTYVIHMSREFFPSEFLEANGNIILYTSGKIGICKGTDLIIDTVKILLHDGYRVKWFIAGKIDKSESNMGTVCINRIHKECLEDNLIVLGHKQNPYPYFANCDIYVHPSRYEGLSVAIQEAKMLCKPILVTNHSSVDEIIIDNFNGLVCDICAKSIAHKIEDLINDESLRNRLSLNLQNSLNNNSLAIDSLIDFFENL